MVSLMASLRSSVDVRFRQGIFNSFATCKNFDNVLISFLQPSTRLQKHFFSVQTSVFLFYFFNPSYGVFAWAYQITKNNYLILIKLHEPLTRLSTIFLSLFSHPLTYINPTTFMDAILHVKTLSSCLMLCIFYSLCNTQQAHHDCNNPHNHTRFLLALASQTNHRHIVGHLGHMVRVFMYCFVAHLLGLVSIRKIFQQVWVFIYCFVTHFLDLVFIRNIFQLRTIFPYSFNACLLGLEIVRNKKKLSRN